jgi:hypothetical protein
VRLQLAPEMPAVELETAEERRALH